MRVCVLSVGMWIPPCRCWGSTGRDGPRRPRKQTGQGESETTWHRRHNQSYPQMSRAACCSAERYKNKHYSKVFSLKHFWKRIFFVHSSRLSFCHWILDQLSQILVKTSMLQTGLTANFSPCVTIKSKFHILVRNLHNFHLHNFMVNMVKTAP